jgi:hypothetical protein
VPAERADCLSRKLQAKAQWFNGCPFVVFLSSIENDILLVTLKTEVSTWRKP